MDLIIVGLVIVGLVFYARSLLRSHKGRDARVRLYSLFGTLFLIGPLIYLVLYAIFPGSNFLGNILLGFAFGWILTKISDLIATRAEQKGRSWLAFYWITVLLSPIISIIIVATLPPKHDSSDPKHPSKPDQIENIRRLSQLRDEGILTEEEFQEKKRSLLDGLDLR